MSPSISALPDLLSFGTDAMDMRLGGGIARTGLHEIYAAAADDAAAASAFALLTTLRAVPAGRAILWITEERGEKRHGPLYAPGLSELGCAPERIVLVRAPDTLAALRAASDAVCCKDLAALIVELSGKVPKLDLTASRRLKLAAARSGVLAIIIRHDAEPMPSAALTRWQVKSAPAQPLEADVPGLPTFDIALIRHRGGVAPFSARLSWDADALRFCAVADDRLHASDSDATTSHRNAA